MWKEVDRTDIRDIWIDNKGEEHTFGLYSYILYGLPKNVDGSKMEYRNSIVWAEDNI